MILEKYTIENTNIKFYDDCIIKNIINQNNYIDTVIVNLIKKMNSSLL